MIFGVASQIDTLTSYLEIDAFFPLYSSSVLLYFLVFHVFSHLQLPSLLCGSPMILIAGISQINYVVSTHFKKKVTMESYGNNGIPIVVFACEDRAVKLLDVFLAEERWRFEKADENVDKACPLEF